MRKQDGDIRNLVPIIFIRKKTKKRKKKIWLSVETLKKKMLKNKFISKKHNKKLSILSQDKIVT